MSVNPENAQNFELSHTNNPSIRSILHKIEAGGQVYKSEMVYLGRAIFRIQNPLPDFSLIERVKCAFTTFINFFNFERTREREHYYVQIARGYLTTAYPKSITVLISNFMEGFQKKPSILVFERKHRHVEIEAAACKAFRLLRVENKRFHFDSSKREYVAKYNKEDGLKMYELNHSRKTGSSSIYQARKLHLSPKGQFHDFKILKIPLDNENALKLHEREYTVAQAIQAKLAQCDPKTKAEVMAGLIPPPKKFIVFNQRGEQINFLKYPNMGMDLMRAKFYLHTISRSETLKSLLGIIRSADRLVKLGFILSDIKPENIVIKFYNVSCMMKMIDLGTWYEKDDRSYFEFSCQRRQFGHTKEYLHINDTEQTYKAIYIRNFEDFNEIMLQSAVFGFGAIVYFSLKKKLPYPVEEGEPTCFVQDLYHQLSKENLPFGLAALLSKALHPEPSKRISLSSFAKGFELILGGGINPTRHRTLQVPQ